MKLLSESKFISTVDTTTRELAKLRLRQAEQLFGVIESVLIVSKTVYVIAREALERFSEDSTDPYKPLFNNPRNIDESKLSPFELYMPVWNLHPESMAIQPEEMLGKQVLVNLIDNKVVKCEYVGDLSRDKQTPLGVVQAVLENARTLAGAYEKLSDNTLTRQYLKNEHNFSDDQVTALDTALSDYRGKVVRIKNDSTFHNTTDAKQPFEVLLDNKSDLIKGTNKLQMKTRNCHLPVTVFSAR